MFWYKNVLNQYPRIKLDIPSHTDRRGTFKYNIDLSNRRAKSTIKWLVKNGINQNRLIGKRYGESLINTYSDGVEYMEEEHQINRRSELIINEL